VEGKNVYKTIGQNIQRSDALVKLTGTCKYVGDLQFPGMLHAMVLRSPYAHAVIKNIDVHEAKKTEGVIKILTGKDISEPIGVAIKDQYPLAKNKVRFVGEPIAVVVAATLEICAHALSKINISYEELPFVLTPEEAIKVDAPILHEDFSRYEIKPYVYPEENNIYHHYKIRKGEYTEAFSESDFIIEKEFWSPYTHHVQLEPHCAIAVYNLDQSMTMYATTQAPFVVQHCISELHNLAMNKVQVIVPYIGGGFGGKSDVTIEPLVSCIAKSVPGRYIKLRLSREEMFEGTNLGRGALCKYKLGIKKDGEIIALQAECYLGSGGYADYAVNIVSGIAMAATGPYEIKNVRVDAYGVYTNTPPVGAMRGYGHPEVHLAIERMIDLAAIEIEMSPYKLRIKNLLRKGRKNGIGQLMTEHNGRVDLCTQKVFDYLEENTKDQSLLPNHIRIGRGIASYMKTPIMPSNVQSGAILKLNGDGTINLIVSAIEMGQGTYTALSQIAAEALSIDAKLIHIVQEVDTLKSPYEWQTVASHTTWGVGNAIIIAANELKRKIKHEVAKFYDCKASDIEINGTSIRCLLNDQSITFQQAAVGLKSAEGQGISTPFIAEGYFIAKHVTNGDKETGQGETAADWTFGCAGAEVSIDIETGEIFINRLVNAIDAGTIINQQIAEDQVLGGMIMALSSTLSEKIIFSDQGKIRNNNLVDYKVLGYEDMPQDMKVFFIETPEETGPFGARGLGEHGAVAVAPAVLNAIYDAIGINFYELPVTADRVVKALEGSE
jgi:CO/xanthine dehydrogenase Mo-binding subunit